MQDKGYTVLAFIGAIILFIVTVYNYKDERSEKIFAIGDYYTPKVSNEEYINEVNLYSKIQKGNTEKCPVTELEISNNIIDINTYPTSSAEYKENQLEYLFVDNTLITLSSIYNEADTIQKKLAFNDNYNKPANNLNIKDLFGIEVINDVDYYNIVAPYNFMFVNKNSTYNERGKIIIINKSKDIRITFDNCSNWFCSGKLSNENYNGDIEMWLNHSKSHKTEIGNSYFSELKGGSYGSIIGYGNSSTTITIEKIENNISRIISLREAIEYSSIDN